MATRKALLVITGHNVAPYLSRSLAALAQQSEQRWEAIFVDDASTDETWSQLQQLVNEHGLRDRFTFVRNSTRAYKAHNVYRALEKYANRDRAGNADDVVVIHDGDDWLHDTRALEILLGEHDRGWEVVWSAWRATDGRKSNSDYLNPWIPPRLQPWASSHLFSFRLHLFDAVEASDLQDENGRWLRETCDAALAWPILEQTIRRKFTPRVLQVYNRENPLNCDKLGPLLRGRVSEAQARTQSRLRRRPQRPMRADWRFALAHAPELLGSALWNARLVRRYWWMVADAWRFRTGATENPT